MKKERSQVAVSLCRMLLTILLLCVASELAALPTLAPYAKCFVIAVLAVLAVVMLVPRWAIFRFSGAVIFFFVVVAGHEHVRGPLVILAYRSFQAEDYEPVLQITFVVGVVLFSTVMTRCFSYSRLRASALIFSDIVLLISWLYIFSHTMPVANDLVMSAPFLIFSVWQLTIHIWSLGKRG